MSPAAYAALKAHLWPGNVRELANLIERLGILHGGKPVALEDLPPKYRRREAEAACLAATPGAGEGESASLPAGGIDLQEYLRDIEVRYITLALSESEGVVSRAAERLGLRRTTLVEKLRKYNLQRAGIQRGRARTRKRRRRQDVAGRRDAVRARRAAGAVG